MKSPLPFAAALFIGLLAAGPAIQANSFAPSNVPRKFLPPQPAPTGEILETPPVEVNGYVQLGFDRLGAFLFTPPDYDPAATPNKTPPSVDGQIPKAIKALDGRKVMVTGFMVPVHTEGAYVVECMLVRSPMVCCYGIVPNVNEWVIVKMKAGANMPPLMDVPLSIYGTLHVHGQYENGYLTGIYFLEGERMEQTKAPESVTP